MAGVGVPLVVWQYRKLKKAQQERRRRRRRSHRSSHEPQPASEPTPDAAPAICRPTAQSVILSEAKDWADQRGDVDPSLRSG